MSQEGLKKRTLFWEQDARNNGGYIHSQYEQIQKAVSDTDYALRMQQENLRAMLEFMCVHSPFYRNYNPADGLGAFPFMSKKDLIAHHETMAVAYEDIPCQTGEVFIQKTSGSTGVPFAMPQDTRKRQRRIAEVKAYSALCGYESHEPMTQCRVWTKWHHKSDDQAERENIWPVNVLLQDDKNLAETCNLVKEKQIVAIRAYASWFTRLMNYLIRTPHELHKLATLTVCFPHSENLDAKTKDFFENILHASMCSSYANEECGIFGQQMAGETHFDLNNTGYVFELLKLDSDEPAGYGELGRIVVTDLHQRAFPVIRYDTGDTGVFAPAAPESPLPKLERLYGRKLDLVFDAQGRPIHPMSFNRVLKNLDHLQQWQFVQKGKDAYELRVVANENFDSDTACDEIASFLGEGATLRLARMDEIPTQKNGKHRSVLCQWEDRPTA